MSRCLVSQSAALLWVLVAILLQAGPVGAAEQDGSPGPDSPAEAEATRTIDGIVLDEDGRPQPDVAVWLAQSDGAGYDRWQQQTTDEHGRFQFAGTATRSIQVTAIGEGPRFGVLGRRFQPGQPLKQLEVLLPRQVGTLTLKVTDEGGAPIAGATPEWVSWVPPEASRVWLQSELFRQAGLEIATSDQDGLLRLPGLPQGAETDVHVSHPDFAGQKLEGVRVGEDLAATIELDPGQMLSVQAVHAEDGAPVSDATVTVYAGGLISIKEPVDENGLYSIRVPTDARALIRVEHETLEARTLPSLSRSDWQAATFRSALPPKPIRVSLYPRGTISGQVFDEENGEPVADLFIEVTADEKSPKVWYGRTDLNGRYEIAVAAGPVTIDISNGVGYEPLDREAVSAIVDADSTVTADELRVRRLPKIRGIVRTADGEPVQDREAIVLVGFGRSTPVRVDDQGRFEYPLRTGPPSNGVLPIEAFHLTQSASGSKKLGYNAIEEGAEVVITLNEMATVRGQVVDADGAPVAGINVWLWVSRTSGEFGRLTYSAPTVTDDEGRYEFRGVERGNRCVPVLWQDSEPMTAPMTIEDGNVTFDRIVVPTAQAMKIPRSPNATTQAPMLACDEWINTEPLDLATLRGQVVLLDFWGTWCGPCVAELPNIQELHELYGERGLTIIAVHDNSTPPQKIREFLDARELTFPVAVDNANGTTIGRYNVSAFPTKVLIDRQGRIVAGEIHSTSELWKLVREQVLDR
jgi:protocatechuate 3,4-dioxygenase beta subunit/thiol-disulfide isomerase/thioredoxin